MTARVASATGRPTIVFLHFLGGSADSWKPVEDILAFRFRCRRFDLPGFGGSPHREGQAVAEMADRVVAAMGGTAPTRWIVAGHSMGAKVALLLARRAENGDERLSGLRGVVSVAGSPPGPEPMEDDKRAEMLRWFAGDEASSRREADGYVRNNVGAELPRERHEAAVADVLRAERHAWRRWLTHGSREDLRGEVGELAVPALVIVGGADEALGEDAQREHTLPHLRHHELAVLPGLGHLLPIEAPEEVAERIA
ncbi:MAG: alpha/beta hydrolase, partial [Gluconacetobacter diazotrophicus]|nr:alpha/beta hydrolase [Gluconacetobacter diazotrophicus]